MNKIKIFENKEIGISARTMLSGDGSVSINAEDTAIGFGWAQEKNGKTYVKQERINGFCKELGFHHLCGKTTIYQNPYFTALA